MNRVLLIATVLMTVFSMALAAERLRFWNLTTVTIPKLYLAPPGTDKWGKNQCENDPDGSVSPDERLNITGVDPGVYDVRLADTHGRVCIVRKVEVRSGRPYAFSISDKDLIGCTK